MSVSKKYFWLKLKENFFSDPKIKKLRKIAGGDTYTIILQKIMLLSIRDEGVIKFQGIEKTLHEELALILDEDESNVEIALSFMNSAGLIESLADEEFLLPSVIGLIGSEGDSAERMRKLRERSAHQKQLLSQCDGMVTESDTEKELELREKYNTSPKPPMKKTGGGVNSKMTLSQIADIHHITQPTLEAYIEFRLNSGGVMAPEGFKRHLMAQLSHQASEEVSTLEEWLDINMRFSDRVDIMVGDLLSCPRHLFSRKSCYERSKGDYYPAMHGFEPNDMMIEIAFQIADREIKAGSVIL